MIVERLNIAYSCSGLLIGLLVGLTGVGGGSLMTPLLILVFGMRATNAVGLDLLFAAITKAFGTVVHGSARTVEWRIAWHMLAGSIPMALITLGLINRLGLPNGALDHAVSASLGVALIVTAASVVLRPQITRYSQRLAGAAIARHSSALTVLLGAALGVLVSFTSVGAAAIGLPLLLLLHPRVPSARLVGADIAQAVPLTLVAGMGHLFVHAIDPALLLSLVAGSIPGVVIGSLAAGRLPDGVLRYAMSTALVLAGAKLLT